MKHHEMLQYRQAMRIAICQYCIDHDISIYAHCENQPQFMTTQAETDRADKENQQVKYVAIEAIERFERNPRSWQVREAIARDYDIREWNNWQLIQEILGIEISSVTAKRISDALNIRDKMLLCCVENMPNGKEIRGRYL